MIAFLVARWCTYREKSSFDAREEEFYFHHSLQFCSKMQANKHAKLCSCSFHPCALQGRALRHFHFSRSNSRDFPFIFCLPSSSSCSNITNPIHPFSPETQASWKWFSCVKRGWLRAFAVMEDQSAQLDGKGCACGGRVSERLYNNHTRYCKNICLQTDYYEN